jgi:hypothetical protein
MLDGFGALTQNLREWPLRTGHTRRPPDSRESFRAADWEQTRRARVRSRMALPPALARTLRPAVQVPVANACAFAGIAAIVMHFLATAQLSPVAVPSGVALTGVASLAVMRLLFTRSTDVHRSRVHAVLWPPLLGAIVGTAVDLGMRLGHPHMRIGFAGISLGGGVAEAVAVAVLSAIAGILGTAIVLPQVNTLARARASDARSGAHVAHAAGALALRAWASALAIGALACALAAPGEVAAPAVIAALGALGLASQGAHAQLARESDLDVACGPYR